MLAPGRGMDAERFVRAVVVDMVAVAGRTGCAAAVALPSRTWSSGRGLCVCVPSRGEATKGYDHRVLCFPLRFGLDDVALA